MKYFLSKLFQHVWYLNILLKAVSTFTKIKFRKLIFATSKPIIPLKILFFNVFCFHENQQSRFWVIRWWWNSKCCNFENVGVARICLKLFVFLCHEKSCSFFWGRTIGFSRSFQEQYDVTLVWTWMDLRKLEWPFWMLN